MHHYGTMTESAVESAIVVEVAEVGRVVDAHRRVLDPSAAWGLPAHVTVLYPFIPPAQLDEDAFSAIERALSGLAGFEVAFSRTAWFGEQVLWLAPEPDDPFRLVTSRLIEAYPDYPPYGGAIADPIPHLTVGDGSPIQALRQAEEAIRARLPIVALVTHVSVMTGSFAEDSWKTVSRIRLAG